MYHPDAFNSAGLFQNLGGWIRSTPAESKLHFYFSALLQRAHHALFHIAESERLQVVAGAQFASSLADVPVNVIELRGASPVVSATIIHITAALAAIRILQDDVWQLLRERSGARNAPNSIRNAVDALSAGLVGPTRSASRRPPAWCTAVPTPLAASLVEYWSVSGGRVATYRDMDQHHNVIATGCFVTFDAGRTVAATVVLPDNPEVKSVAKYRYSQRIDGVGPHAPS